MQSTVQILYLRVFAKRIIYHYMVGIYQYLTDDARVHKKLFDGNINYRFSILMIKNKCIENYTCTTYRFTDFRRI
ncbi:Uncharacterised protein [Niallia circulans]|nr:Uncharacterised protein [Niallia circulans]